ncbi:hypothetical protein LTS17_009774 [Exophiala oligosperma]
MQSETVGRDSSSIFSPLETWTPQNPEGQPVALVDSQTQEQLRDESRAVNSRSLPLGKTSNGPAISSFWDNDIFSADSGLDSALDLDEDILMAMDLDWSSLVQLDFDLSNEGSNSRHEGRSRDDNGSTSGSRSRGFLVQEFFKRSLWLWEPDARDSTSTEEAPHLSEVEERHFLSSKSIEKASDDRADGSSWMAGFTCGNEARDALLILAQRNADNGAVLRCFPSPRVLSFLLKAFAFQETVNRCPFVHLPSFNVDKCKIELLSALVVAGSANFANRMIWKLGLALQERTRIAIYKILDHNNPVTPDLDILQAQILWVEAGLWSGVRRRMEIAEAAANNLPLMIRRAGAYYLGYSENMWVPTFQDDGELLQSKWANWTALESFKRCVFRAFIVDIQGSVAYMRSPRFYRTEITFGLPSAHTLWGAPDPLAWRAANLAERSTAQMPRPTLLDIIQDPSTLQSLPQEYDCELSAFAALHCLWPQIVALQEARTLQRGTRNSKQSSQPTFWLEAQRQDLYKRLAEIKDNASVVGVLTAEARIVCELFMMALFVSFVDIEKLVGRFGIEESRLATPILQSWSEGEELRYAMWHAGQVLKAAQAIKPTQLRGFYAIAVYQTCLVLALPFLLEAIGQAARRQTPEPHTNRAYHHQIGERVTNTRDQANLIVLNGPENMQIKSFLLTGQGCPALLLGDEVRALSNVEVIPTVIAKIFEGNYATTSDHILPMPERLVALVKELAKFTGR